MFVSIFTIFVVSTLNTLAEPICFDGSKENIKQHLATKTPYRFIFNRNDTAVTYPGNDFTFLI